MIQNASRNIEMIQNTSVLIRMIRNASLIIKMIQNVSRIIKMIQKASTAHVTCEEASTISDISRPSVSDMYIWPWCTSSSNICPPSPQSSILSATGRGIFSTISSAPADCAPHPPFTTSA
mmetsp:Transcript_70810/g.103749  ORF Transcript_70810/g.103749 Transcript_70810/m.103749 type:complete len:120 (+) Transcript_70810:28-387(+)